MLIKSNKTGLEQTVSETDWLKMKERGDALKFTIVEKKKELPMRTAETPEEAQVADYSLLLKKASKAFKDQNWASAKMLFEQAKAIKKTAYVLSKLDEIANELKKLEEEESEQ